jgi:filamentous hemagglutinin family protein
MGCIKTRLLHAHKCFVAYQSKWTIGNKRCCSYDSRHLFDTGTAMKSHASMNRIYRLVFNAALGIWVAVAENARGKGKAGRAACALLAVLTIISPASYAANALDATLRGGTGTVATVGNTTTIHQTSQRMALDWTQLNTAANEALVFSQPNAQAIALNRITGSTPSSFLGSLTANGQVFILNPNGVLFGAGSQVNVGGIVASTLGMNPTDFMNGSNTFTKTTGTGSVINQGSMTAAQGGYLALLAPEVRNEGVMTASLGTALLAAGNKVTLNLDNGSLLGYSIDQGAINALAENKQLIKADGGQVLLSARAMDALTTATVNNTGVIEARTIQNVAGRIMLMGDMEHGTVNVAGTLDASAATGNGGFIETSAAKVKVADSAIITTKAQAGQTGTWLIDPTDFKIAATGGDISGAALGTALGSNNVTYSSAQGAGGSNGDVLVNDTVSWSSNNALSLNAQRNIDFSGGGSLNASGATSRVNLTAGQGGAGAVIGGTGVAVTANTLSIDAATGIGSAATPLQTNVANLRLNNTASGGVYANNAKDVTVAAKSVGGDVRISTANGIDDDYNSVLDVGIPATNGGSITVGSVAGMNGITTTGTGNITLATGAGGNKVNSSDTNPGSGGNITVNQTLTAGGHVQLTAGDSGSGGGNPGFGATSGGAGGSIAVNAAVSAGGNATFNAGNGAENRSRGGSLAATGGSITLNASLTTVGSARLQAGAGGQGFDDFSGTAFAGGNGGSVTLTALSSINAGTSVTLLGGQGGSAIDFDNGGAGGSVATGGTITAGATVLLQGGQAGNSGLSSVFSGGAVYVNAAISGSNLSLLGGDGAVVASMGSAGGLVSVTANLNATGNVLLKGGDASSAGGGAGVQTGGSVQLQGTLTAGGNVTLQGGRGSFKSGTNSGTLPTGGAGGSVLVGSALTATGNVLIAAGAGGAGTYGAGPGAAGNIAVNSNITSGGNATLSAGAVTSSAGASIAANTLSIDAATGIGSTANALQTNVNNLRLNNTASGGVYAHNAKDVTVAAKSVNGDVRISTAAGVAGTYDYNPNTDTETITPATNGGAITVGTVAGMNGITTTGNADVRLSTGAGGLGYVNVSANGDGGKITVNQAINSGGNVVLQAATGGGDGGAATALLTFGGTGGSIEVNAAITAAGAANLTAGRAAVLFSASQNPTASNGGSVLLNARLQTGAGATLTAGSGGTASPNSYENMAGGNGGSVTTTALGVIAAGTAVTLQAGSGGDATYTAAGGFGGSVVTSGSITAGGNVALVAGSSGFSTDGGMSGDRPGGAVTTHAAINAGGNLNLMAGNGKGTSLPNASTSGGSVMANANLSATGNVVVTAGNASNGIYTRSGGSVVLNGSVSAGGSASISSGSGTSMPVNTVNRVGGSGGNITVNGGITTGSNASLTTGTGGNGMGGGANGTAGQVVGSNVTVTSGGNITVTGNTAASRVKLASSAGDITLNGTISTTDAGDAIVLAANKKFVNNAGANALTVANGGRWLVYSQTPVGNTFGGLVSGNAALWNTTFNPASPSVASTGNRFIFSNADSGVAVVAANDISKTYGDAFTGSFGYTAQVAGGQDFGNAYTDARGAAVALTGTAPNFSSAGAAATATRNGGNAGGAGYDIIASLTGATAAGYTLLAAKGTLTVDARPINISGSRTYDSGTSVAAVALTAGNTRNGDVITLTGTGSVADKNVANGKALTRGTLALGGAAAVNYTLAGGAASVNITPADLSVTVTGVDKVYDGTTAATVRYTDNRYAGDNLSYSSSASFQTKDAGFGKLMNISNVTKSGVDAGNYNIVGLSLANTADVTPKHLIVTAKDDARIVGGAPYSGGNGVTFNGLVASETPAVLGGTLAYSGDSQGARALGAYDITPGGLTSGNYGLSFVSGELQIVPVGTVLPGGGAPPVVVPVATPTVLPVVAPVVASPAARPAEALVTALGGTTLVPAYQAVLQGVAGVGGTAGGGVSRGAGAGGGTGGPVFLLAPSAEE